MTTIFWREFGVLFAATLLGGAAVMPYVMKLVKKPGQQKAPRRLSAPLMVLLSLLQTAVLSAAAVGLGLLAAHAIGLGAPYLEAALAGRSTQGIGNMAILAGLTGALAGVILLGGDLLFLPYWPQALVDATRRATVWDNFFGSFYGGINEEILMRLFGLGGLAWLLSFAWHTPTGGPTTAGLWLVNVIMAIVFGVGHLPALKNILGNLPRLMVARSLLLNAPVALLCGWLFWTYGIEAAIIAHFSADIVYHVLGTALLGHRLAPAPAGQS